MIGINNQALLVLLILCGCWSFSSGNELQDEITAIVGSNLTLVCNSLTDKIWWSKDGRNITINNKKYFADHRNVEIDEIGREIPFDEQAPSQFLHVLNVSDVEIKDSGNYTCHKIEANAKNLHFIVQSIIEPKITNHSPAKIQTKLKTNVVLFCLFEAFPMDNYNYSIKWTKVDDPQYQWGNRTGVVVVNDTLVNSTFQIDEAIKNDNGTYECSIQSPYTGQIQKFESSLLVLDVPHVSIDFVKAVGANKIFLNWTINDGNDPVQQYFVQYMKEGDSTFTYYNHVIDGRNVSYVLENFEPSTTYQIKITAKNNMGLGPANTYAHGVRTLESDPVFIPKISVKGNTHSTITIGWSPPSADILDFIHYYELVVAAAGDNSTIIEEAIHPQNSRNLPYMFDHLQTATDYKFRVRSCSELTKQCGNWSDEVTGTTMDGQSSEPLNLVINCTYYNISGRSTVSATWSPPARRNGKITSYQIILNGVSTFRTDRGFLKNETYGPKVKNVEIERAIYESVPSNTNYTLKVSGVTRSKKPGDFTSATCTMPPTLPDIVDSFLWGKVQTELGHWVFKMFLNPVSQRTGPICGYRVYMVKLGSEHKYLTLPEEAEVMSYNEAHAPNNSLGGAYIAEIFPSDDFQKELILGDGHSINVNETMISREENSACRKLLRGYYVRSTRQHATTISPQTVEIADQLPVPPPMSTQKERLDKAGNLTSEASKILNSKNRRKRQPIDNSIPIDDDVKTTTASSITINSNGAVIFDGPLDPSAVYTAFVEVIVKLDDDRVMSAYSNYFEMMTGGPVDSSLSGDASVLNTVTQVLCGMIILCLLLLLTLYVWHRYSKTAAQGDEVISLRDSLSRALCGGRNGTNHRHLIGSASTKPTDMGPISKSELPQAYINRHKDTDYGFLREYEMLPNRFNDRTTKHSDAKENAFKNRYPDIKAYDQTRVRLAERNGTIGSDYINANFVLGYKERKKFICAQGPMDSTVNDFWRMIWEQHLEIIVMLTNLEEYNKAKCSKYWPEKVDDSTKFGEITVTFLEEQRYSDYLIRDLRVTRRYNNETNEDEERHITQYHYLVWKDFMAPEHPHGIIKFIRQINSVYSLQRGPILVHCSAGVGRTGTLVALDSLMQQLDDEGQVSIYNTVCDMRHQRNFLVQSLKQYIFLYRALLDIAQFGNTELPAKELSAAVDNLKARPPDSKEQCKLEIEFEKIKSITDESNKTCAIGSGEENRCKNRSELVIPFDRNRVILNPVPGRDHSTYINASFIEGYDNSESFIITQDPLEETIADFWRMVSEQGINTIVMISEIGDGPKKCPRYWADDEIQYDHILVKYMQSDIGPYYTRREFNVTNCKMKDTIKVTQFQYNGWPTVEGEVPEVARGMIELVDQAQNHHNDQENFGSPGPIAIHCNLGTDRSSIYVAMCILVQHLRTEKKIDVCTTTRKLRSQRHMLLDTYAQYEFLHRAIVNYADLHRLSADSPSDC
ncbi:Tyrosine-protein phosphatase 69D [Pseudolycoriella hygida]|uniref:protein-tyrosine-phosphatase n=1 Tax=Pseudolycoriella hygida TaxID=35572 RepID=A0A9Q0MRD1_9DIPT|nr:Tyrosine-protein phosphatase 69D [Pseudolycoriella hygida]